MFGAKFSIGVFVVRWRFGSSYRWNAFICEFIPNDPSDHLILEFTCSRFCSLSISFFIFRSISFCPCRPAASSFACILHSYHLHSPHRFHSIFWRFPIKQHSHAQMHTAHCTYWICPLNNCFTLISPIQSFKMAKMHFTPQPNRRTNNTQHWTGGNWKRER